MRNKIKFLGIIALVAVMGFGFVACPNDGGGKKGTAPKITTVSLPDGTMGVEYSQTLEATGDTPITWSISGELPDGLTLDETMGKITGRPTTAETSTFTVKATNSAGNDTKKLSITVVPPYIVTPSGDVFTASGGTLSMSFTPAAIQEVINAIRDDAKGKACAITFGEDDATLNIGTASILFTNTEESTWGAITLLGKITSAITNSSTISAGGSGVSIESRGEIKNTGGNLNSRAINYYSTGRLTVSDGTVSATGDGYAIRNGGTGAITVSGGMVSAVSGAAIYNDQTSTGAITVSGGTVSVSAASGVAIYNYGTDTVTVSGGTVSATNNRAIANYRTGVVYVSGDAVVTSATTSMGTIYLANSGSTTTDRLIMTGGTVSNTTSSGWAGTGSAISNDSTGGVTISAGTVSADGGRAIGNYNTGVIKISGTALVTSRTFYNTGDTNYGTIYIGAPTNDTTAERLIILGGRVENTAANNGGRAILNYSTGGVTVSGGTVSAGSGYAIATYSTGVIKISNPAVVTSGNGATIYIDSSCTGTDNLLEISGGTVSYTSTLTGYAIRNLSPEGGVKISGGTISSEAGNPSSTATISNGGGKITILDGTIRNNATTNTTYTITNGTGTITVLGGKVLATAGYAISNSGTVEVSGGTVEATTGAAIYNSGTSSTVVVSGGTVSATEGYAINNYNGTTTVSNGKVSTTTGIAINNRNGTKIDILGTAEVTSANPNATEGTINIAAYTPSSNSVVLEITGGTVSNTASGGNAINNDNTAKRVTVSGGTVSATTGNAINNTSTARVDVTGGTVLATTGYAINNASTATVNINTKGTVFAYGSASTDVVNGTYTRADTGLIIWYVGGYAFAREATVGLGSEPSTPTATVWWDYYGPDSGIGYKNGANEGFIKVDGVTVR